MKKLFVACLLGLALSAAVSAQSGNTYFNIGLIGTRMAQPEFLFDIPGAGGCLPMGDES